MCSYLPILFTTRSFIYLLKYKIKFCFNLEIIIIIGIGIGITYKL